MRIAVLGRTEMLLATARRLLEHGHEIPLIGTCRAEAHYNAREADFHALAKSIGALFFDDTRINSAEHVSEMTDARCDVAVSMNWLTIIGEQACAAFPHGILNAHAGDLPRYRGNACPNWAILNGESHVGLCIHVMKPGELDNGPILLRDRFPLGADTYIGDVNNWMDERIPALYIEAVEGLAAGTIKSQPQSTDSGKALRCYPRRPEDGRIDWTQSAEMVHRLVRASSRPFPGAFTMLEGERRLTVWRAEIGTHAGPYLAVPGQVLFREESDPVIACGEGVLRLTDIALEGCADGKEARTQVARSLRNRLV